MSRILVLGVGLVVLGVFFGVAERLWPGRRQPLWRRGIKTDVAWWFFDPIVGQAVSFVAVVVVVIVMARIAGVPLDKQHLNEFIHRDTVISSQPALLQAIEALLLFDLIGYWSHRAFHRIELLWRYHAVHHSSTDLDWLSSVRVHPLNEAGTRIAQAVPLVLIGFSPGVLAAYVPLLTLYAIMLHANVNWNFGRLKYVIGSPVYHRWHHTTEKEGLDRDFAAMFPWMDKLFGTLYFPVDRMPMEFGVLGENVPNNILKQLAYPFRKKATYAARPSDS